MTEENIKVYLGGDHRGFNLARELLLWLIEQGVDIIDVGAKELDPNDDYVDFAQEVGVRVAKDTEKGINVKGIVLCGSGVGVDIVANKINGIRCGLGINAEQVRSARADDDINVLAVSADNTSSELAKEMIKVFLDTDFSQASRHERRIKKITNLEND